jgi:hypothetical protein
MKKKFGKFQFRRNVVSQLGVRIVLKEWGGGK